MATFIVKFDRVGRHHEVPDFHVTAEPGDWDSVMWSIYGHVGRFLMSGEYYVSLDPEDGTGLIDGGRFGTFTVEVQDA